MVDPGGPEEAARRRIETGKAEQLAGPHGDVEPDGLMAQSHHGLGDPMVRKVPADPFPDDFALRCHGAADGDAIGRDAGLGIEVGERIELDEQVRHRDPPGGGALLGAEDRYCLSLLAKPGRGRNGSPVQPARVPIPMRHVPHQTSGRLATGG